MLDWQLLQEREFSVDEAEICHNMGTCSNSWDKRGGNELRLPPLARKDMLNGCFSNQEIHRAEQDCRRIQYERMKSSHVAKSRDLEYFDMVLTKINKKIRKWTLRRPEPTLAERWLKTHKQKVPSGCPWIVRRV